MDSKGEELSKQIDVSDLSLDFPKNLEAERIILGSLLLEPDRTWPKVEGVLEDIDFFGPGHGRIFKVAHQLFLDGKAADVVGVVGSLKEHNWLEKVGGRLYMNDLLDSIVTTEAVEHYAEIVRRKSGMRALIEAGRMITHIGLHGNGNLAESRDVATKAFNRAMLTESKTDIVSISTIGDEFLGQLESMRKTGGYGLTSGFKSINRYLRDFSKQLTVIAGAPSVGKSLLMINMGYRQAHQGIKVGFISLEMVKETILGRLVQLEGRYSEEDLFYKPMDDITKTIMTVLSKPIWITVLYTASLISILRQMRQMVMVDNIEVIYVDHLQLMEAGGFDSKSDELGRIVRDLFLFSKRYGVGVVLGCQLNRQVMQQSGEKRPKLFMLRSSGQIEEHADSVLGLYRPDYADKAAKGGVLEIEFLKNRKYGHVGKIIKLACLISSQRLEELAATEMGKDQSGLDI